MQSALVSRARFARVLLWQKLTLVPTALALVGFYDLAGGQIPAGYDLPRIGDLVSVSGPWFIAGAAVTLVLTVGESAFRLSGRDLDLAVRLKHTPVGAGGGVTLFDVVVELRSQLPLGVTDAHIGQAVARLRKQMGIDELNRHVVAPLLTSGMLQRETRSRQLLGFNGEMVPTPIIYFVPTAEGFDLLRRLP